MKSSDEPSSPILGHLVEYSFSGLSKRQQACIQLCVAETGDQELDAIIRKAQRAKFAGLAVQAWINHHGTAGGYSFTAKDAAKSAIECADALVSALEK